MRVVKIQEVIVIGEMNAKMGNQRLARGCMTEKGLPSPNTFLENR